jgi:hypothetical protein
VDVSDAVAESLGSHAGSLMIRVADDLPLHRLHSLVQHQGPLALTGLRSLNDRRAGALAAQPGLRGRRGDRDIMGLSGLLLDSVTHLTPGTAATLATHRAGGLSLKGLTELGEEVARQLVKHPLLSLDGLTGVSDRVAAILAAHSGATLSLRSLRDVSSGALAKLRGNPGIELPRRLQERACPPRG